MRWPHVSAFLLLLYWTALVLGTHLPGSAVPAMPASDKSLHFVAFGGLGFLLSWTWATRRPIWPAGAFFVVLIAALYAGVDEITQTLVPGRYADVADWGCDVAGAIAGTAGYCAMEVVLRRVFRGKSLASG
ncbi:MAG: VanZ family protein [Pirellulaceae bacterium]